MTTDARSIVIGTTPGDILAWASRTTLPTLLDRVAFAALYVFFLILFMRPADLFPGVFGGVPLVKIVGTLSVTAFVASRLNDGRRLPTWPVELCAMLAIAALSLLFAPIAASKARAMGELTGEFVKVLCVFVVIVNVVDTRDRLRRLLELLTMCGAVLGIMTLRSYAMGGEPTEAGRVLTPIRGMFGDANDLATAFNVLFPVACAMFWTSRGIRRGLFLVPVILLPVAVLLTESRGGFLGLLVTFSLLVAFQLGRKPLTTIAAVLGTAVLLGIAAPPRYASRLSTILHPSQDLTGSAPERLDELKHALSLAARHLLVGIGMDNYQLYSLSGKRAHNSFVEIWVELGLLGLAAYVIVIAGPIRSMQRLRTRTGAPDGVAWHEGHRQLHSYATGLLLTLAAYSVCSFFLSIEYTWWLYCFAGFAVALRNLAARDPEIANIETGGKRGVLWQRGGVVGTAWRTA